MVKTSQALEKLLSVYEKCDRASYICNALLFPKNYRGFDTLSDEEVRKIRKWIARFTPDGGAFETAARDLTPTNEIERAFKRLLRGGLHQEYHFRRRFRIQFIEYCITHYRRYGQ